MWQTVAFGVREFRDLDLLRELARVIKTRR